jgi:hypothetical protein
MNCRLYVVTWMTGELVVKPTLGISKVGFYFYKGITISKDKMMLIEIRCREHSKPWSFIPGIAEEWP